MNTALGGIQDFVQQLAKVIAAVLELEINIIDSDLRLIAATGYRANEVGSYYEDAPLTAKLLSSGGFYVVEDTHNHSICNKCNRKGNGKCRYLSALVVSIKVEGKVIGTLGVTASTPQQKELLLSKVDDLNHFTKKLSDLLSIVIKEKENHKMLQLLTDKYKTVVDSVYEGIISADANGYITHFNKSAQVLLNIESDKLVLGEHINKLFPDLHLEEALSQKVCLARNLQYAPDKKKKESLAAIIAPIKHAGSVEGLTISLRAMQEMQKIAGRLRLIGEEVNYTFDDIVGESQIIKDIKEIFQKVAGTNSTVLIQGESGTGKGLFARAIHAYSQRTNRPFVSVNCGAIPESLLESELFGYEEGAFTDARSGGKPGKFELAHKGTIFLDEIGDIPLHLQVKLLKVLEESSLERVGGTKPVPVDVRIIAATNRDLDGMMENQEFREDLYYRLSVIPVTIPPLRERKRDIKLLIDKFFEYYTQKMTKRISGFTASALEIMLEYDWPGNVRELENTIEYAVNMVNHDCIKPEHLPDRIVNKPFHLIDLSQTSDLKFREKKTIVDALRKFGNSEAGKEKAAIYLGVSRSTIYRRIKELRKEGII